MARCWARAEAAPATVKAAADRMIFKLGCIGLPRHDALVEPADGVERRGNRALLPGRDVGGVLAGQDDPAVDRAHVVIVLGAQLLGPAAGAAERPGDPMPGDRD